MYRVLLVDDEPTHRMGMNNAIRTFKPDYLLFMAKDGVQGLEMLKQFEVDLVITDIRMPHMDGMTFIEHAKKAGCKAYFIILSGYGEFEYAQHAISLGVNGYLLKPTDPDELLSMLNAFEGRLQEQNAWNQTQMKHMDAYMRMENNSMEREFEAFVLGHLDEKGIREVCTILPGEGAGYILCMRPESDTWSDADINEWKADAYQHFRRWGQMLSFRCMRLDDMIVTLFLSNEMEMASFCQKVQLLSDSFDGYNTTRRGHYVLGISEHTPQLMKNVTGAFRQALSACQLAFYHPGDRLHVYDEKTALHANLGGAIEMRATETAALLLQGDTVGASNMLLEGFCSFYRTHRPYPSRLKEMLLLCFSTISNQLGAVVDPAALRTLISQMDRAIKEAVHVDALKELIGHGCSTCCELVNRRRASINEDVIEHAMQLLQQEYAHHWTLQELAEKCHFNSSYFSSLFKQHTGIGYLDYLTTIRIDQAACLLRQSNMPIHRLSARVGYPNTAYFIKLFRAKYGLTPVEYRKAEQK